MILPNHPVIYFLQEVPAENQGLWDTIVHSNILNFLIAFFFLVWVFKRFDLLSLLDKRQAQIVNDLKEAEEKRKKALAELQEIEKRTAKMAEEVEAVLKEAQQTAEVVAASIVKNAEAEAEKLLNNARKRILLEERTAARDLENRLMHEAIHSARQLLENTLTDDDKHRSVENFVSSLPDLYKQEVKQ